MAYGAAVAAVASAASKAIGWLKEKFGGCTPKSKEFWTKTGREDMVGILYNRDGPGKGVSYCKGTDEGKWWLAGTRSVLSEIGAPPPPNFHNPPKPFVPLHVTYGKMIVTGNAGLGAAAQQALAGTLKSVTGVDYRKDPTNSKLQPYIKEWVDFNKLYETWREDARLRFEAWKAGKAPPPAKGSVKPQWFGRPSAKRSIERAMKAVASGAAGPASLAAYARLNPKLSQAIAQTIPSLSNVQGIANIPGVSSLISGLESVAGDLLEGAGEALEGVVNDAADAAGEALGDWLDSI